ncbi:hypothetical protein JYU34_000277 [Plutella xylostella]|uniref:Uncharacterized protein n=1 Tax=Plutella xylostella TaxID=51655 RepID=A0ABQ7R7H0_PLUXY|nr:hypothetical protein JYU34_000277 [Plutella xylostella]
MCPHSPAIKGACNTGDVCPQVYAMVCVISQFQEYLEGRGTAAQDYSDRLASVQYMGAATHTATTSTAPGARRKSAGRPAPSRVEPDDYSEAPSKISELQFLTTTENLQLTILVSAQRYFTAPIIFRL